MKTRHGGNGGNGGKIFQKWVFIKENEGVFSPRRGGNAEIDLQNQGEMPIIAENANGTDAQVEKSLPRMAMAGGLVPARTGAKIEQKATKVTKADRNCFHPVLGDFAFD